MKVKFWYKCRGCGKSWYEVEEYEGENAMSWVEAHGVKTRHQCSDRQIGAIEFVKAKAEVIE